MKKELSIVMVVYGDRSGAVRALSLASESLARSGITHEAVVVDNGPGDERLSVSGLACAVQLLDPGGNLGFSRAANLAVGSTSGNRLLFLNPDVRPAGDALARLVATADRLGKEGDDASIVRGGDSFGGRGCRFGSKTSCRGSGVGMVGAGLVPPGDEARAALDGRGLLGWGWFHFRLRRFARRLWPGMFGLDLGNDGRDRAVEVDWVAASASVIERSTFVQAGGFCPSYFMYFEDVDLCLRLKRSGCRNFLVPGARCVHLGGTSYRYGYGASRGSAKRWADYRTSRDLFLRKYASPVTRLAARLLSRPPSDLTE